ncbi:8801_t:CDS:2 [Gigaspora rosea]|nr:8801_t:CDS:2 [Gigaspora rosea]
MLKREKKLNKQNFDEEEQDLNESANTSVPWSWIKEYCSLCQYSIDIKRCTDLSCYRPTKAQEAARKEPENSESVAEFIVISNTTTMKDLNLLYLQQNESYLDEYRKCFSDMR